MVTTPPNCQFHSPYEQTIDKKGEWFAAMRAGGWSLNPQVDKLPIQPFFSNTSGLKKIYCSILKEAPVFFIFFVGWLQVGKTMKNSKKVYNLKLLKNTEHLYFNMSKIGDIFSFTSMGLWWHRLEGLSFERSMVGCLVGQQWDNHQLIFFEVS